MRQNLENLTKVLLSIFLSNNIGIKKKIDNISKWYTDYKGNQDLGFE